MLNVTGRVAMLNITAPFDSDDIFLAKKCILNKLSKPPNYDLYDFRIDDNKSVSTSTHVHPVINIYSSSNIIRLTLENCCP